MDELTSTALNDPKPGDHWTEMFNWDLFVVGRDGDTVLTLEATRPSTFPNGAKPTVRTLTDFSNHLSYKTNGYNLPKGTWARCIERGRDVTGWQEEKFQKVWKEKEGIIRKGSELNIQINNPNVEFGNERLDKK